MQHAQVQYQMDVTETVLGMVATAHSHDAKMQQRKTGQGDSDV
jgi:hypothetical protein